MLQQARNLTDAEDGFLNDKRLLILDRDPLFTEQSGPRSVQPVYER
jgi:hypothetical protein